MRGPTVSAARLKSATARQINSRFTQADRKRGDRIFRANWRGEEFIATARRAGRGRAWLSATRSAVEYALWWRIAELETRWGLSWDGKHAPFDAWSNTNRESFHLRRADDGSALRRWRDVVAIISAADRLRPFRQCGRAHS